MAQFFTFPSVIHGWIEEDGDEADLADAVTCFSDGTILTKTGGRPHALSCIFVK